MVKKKILIGSVIVLCLLAVLVSCSNGINMYKAKANGKPILANSELNELSKNEAIEMVTNFAKNETKHVAVNLSAFGLVALNDKVALSLDEERNYSEKELEYASSVFSKEISPLFNVPSVNYPVFNQVHGPYSQQAFGINEVADQTKEIVEASVPQEEMVAPAKEAQDMDSSENGQDLQEKVPSKTSKKSSTSRQENKNASKKDVKHVGKRVALTFDDGPHPVNTQKILEILKRYDAKATFFQLGREVEAYPEITKEVYSQGHEIASHSWDHPDFRKLSVKQVEEQISSTQKIIEQATGEAPSFFRPPYGSTNESIKEIASKHGETEILWTIDTLDWKYRNPNAVLQAVKQNVRDGAIILMHDIHPSTVEAVEPVLKYLKAEGYEMVTIGDL
ncbi:polysaccharide deacetylase family protein [Lederbergia citrea]|uniref:polysaccharide deacetylase family protein n=1 Tax=Lederbergia citrea TaxID=2833581 RepID=UPI001BC9607B|nr:polysaccharide deacetylase family protein [Lederbergia citrea]MBS4178181.1 polysaccharide deacetylase family protein [Lederbergia citrea]